MKKLTILLTWIICMTNISAQAEMSSDVTIGENEAIVDVESEFRTERLNNFTLELLGRGGLYSFNYDRRINDRWAAGAGLATYSVTGMMLSSNITVVPLYANYYIKTGKHQAFASAGTNIIFSSNELDGEGTIQGSGLAGVIGGGYEYKADNGMLYRAAPYVFFGQAKGVWLGLSVGYSI